MKNIHTLKKTVFEKTFDALAPAISDDCSTEDKKNSLIDAKNEIDFYPDISNLARKALKPSDPDYHAVNVQKNLSKVLRGEPQVNAKKEIIHSLSEGLTLLQKQIDVYEGKCRL